MLRFILLLMTLALSFAAQAAGCSADKPEKFDKFFPRFVKDAEFAKKRTTYPLPVMLVEPGTQEVRQSKISAEEDAGAPALNDFMQANGLAFGGVKLKKAAATVTVFRADPAWRMGYSFVQQGGCWALKEIEDRFD